MRKISSKPVKGKRVLIRVDLNCPIKEGRIIGDTRISAHSKTIQELSERGAMVIVLAHQGRPGEEDFLTLEQHAKILQEKVGKKIRFLDDIIGEQAKTAIKNMKDGDILLLDNVRQLKCETDHPEAEGEIVQHLAPLADYFILDALSIAHRKHSSVIGFTKKMPSFAGDVLAGEVEAVEKVKSSRDVTFVFGGSKVEESFTTMKKWLAEGRAKYVLVGGALSVLLLKAGGSNIGNSEKFLRNAGLEKFIPEAKEILAKYSDKIILPLDMGVSFNKQRHEIPIEQIKEGELWDIGEKTMNEYARIIRDSGCIVMNGPLGVYEKDEFSSGTRRILEAIAASNAFSLIGGGHTISAIERFGIDRKRFGYVSLSGKALIEYLCGKELAAIKALNENEKSFRV